MEEFLSFPLSLSNGVHFLALSRAAFLKYMVRGMARLFEFCCFSFLSVSPLVIGGGIVGGKILFWSVWLLSLRSWFGTVLMVSGVLFVRLYGICLLGGGW